VNFKTFDELLHLDVSCGLALVQHTALLVIGDQANALLSNLHAVGKKMMQRANLRLLFGLPILTAPFPLFVGGVMTERNTTLQQMSLFGWIEDNTIEQPRAEVFGLTPFVEQPVLFLRDFDMDRPVEVWFQTKQPARWVQVAGVAIATSQHSGQPQVIKGDEAALAALEQTLPADAQPFVASLRTNVTRGQSLRAALRQRRQSAEASLMAVCDGWRVLTQATAVLRLNPAPAHEPEHEASVEDVIRLAPPKRW
jgi:hypothetical protein